MKTLQYSCENWLDFLRLPDIDLLKSCRMDVYKATGKGGQKKNKTSNAIRLTLENLVVYESKSRSKNENLSHALKKMRIEIATDSSDLSLKRESVKRAPSEIENYINSPVIRINERNTVYPFFIGFLVTSFIRNRGSWQRIAEDFGTSSSQVRRFVEKNPLILRKLRELQGKIEQTTSF